MSLDNGLALGTGRWELVQDIRNIHRKAMSCKVIPDVSETNLFPPTNFEIPHQNTCAIFPSVLQWPSIVEDGSLLLLQVELSLCLAQCSVHVVQSLCL